MNTNTGRPIPPSTEDSAAGIASAQADNVRIICYEDVDSWILGKFAKRMQEELTRMGRIADIAKQGNPQASVGHHIIYYDARQKWALVETFMITHIDTDWKHNLVCQQLRLYDMGICMSAETRNRLVNMGMPAQKLCYVNPAQDGVIRPRPLVVGIASKTHADGRKNEAAIVEIFRRLPSGAFILKIMGEGWDEQVQMLQEYGCKVEYYGAFNYDEYVSSFMPSLDYFIYFSYDEGSMAFLDAIAADVRTIVTPQGYHLDLPGGIDFSINSPADIGPILLQAYEERMRRAARIAPWNWQGYTQHHVLIWDYLLEKQAKTYQMEWKNFLQDLAPDDRRAVCTAFHNHAVPESALYEDMQRCAAACGFGRVAAQCARAKKIFYPADIRE